MPGRFPPFLPYVGFTESRELQHVETGTHCEPRSTAGLRRFDFFRKEVFLDLLGLRRAASGTSFFIFFRKEVFQPHLPVRLPCYDLAPITSFALGRSFR